MLAEEILKQEKDRAKAKPEREVGDFYPARPDSTRRLNASVLF